MEQKRNSFLDFQKAILIFCVVWTHCATSFEAGVITWKDNYLNVTITTFQMPLFILISGYLLFYSFQRNKPGVIILKKILEVVVPAAIWNLFSFGVSLLLSGEPVSFNIELIKSGILAIIGGLWYLWVYLLCSVVVCIVNMIAKNEWIRFGILFLVLIASHFAPVNTWYFGFMFPFFLLGYYCNYFLQKNPKIAKGSVRYLVYSLMILYPLFRFLYKPEYSMYITGVSFDCGNAGYTLYAYLIRFLAGLSGCALIYTCSKWVYNFLCRKNMMKTRICRVGEYSMAIYILHSIMIDVIYVMAKRYNVGTFMSDNLELLNFLIAPLCACLLIAISVLIYLILKRIPVIRDVAFGVSIKKLKFQKNA